MAIMAVFRFAVSLGCMVTGRAAHIIQGGMHLMQKCYDPHSATVEINNLLVWRYLFNPIRYRIAK